MIAGGEGGELPDSDGISRRRVLVAEDNPVNRLVTARMLEKLGAVCTVAIDGRAALEAATAEEFDLILMDCQMPEMDGFEATREIRRAGVSTPIVALTARAITGEKEKCIAAGMDGFLTKPLDFRLLAEVVRGGGSC